jgi:peptidoglycan-associated lipoprotein
MMSRIQLCRRGLAFAAVFAVALLAAACASKPNDTLAGAGGAGFGANGGRGGPPGSVGDFTVNVGDRVFFTTDSTDLTPTSRQTLDRQAAWLRRYARYPITIEGHADERGTREYNLALGARRAQVVHDYLVARGVPATRMRTISYGKERPVATCDEERCWDLNRRAVTVLSGPTG